MREEILTMKHIVSDSVVPFDFMGLLIRELTPHELKTASIAEIEVAPSARHERARSTKCDKLYICMQGEVSFRVGTQDVLMHPTDLLVILRNEWFDYSNVTDKLTKLILIHVPPFDLDSEEFEH
jgi:mannose-6-phosphate isomerase-like protein (cupin superfamily)